MATLIKGLLSQNLPWGLVLVGVFIAVTLELCGIHSLSFAVGRVPADRDDGADLRRRPRALVGGAQDRARPASRSLSAGTLFSSGLIAGGSLAGILYAVLVRGKLLAASSRRWAMPCRSCTARKPSARSPARRCSSALAVILSRFAQRKI